VVIKGGSLHLESGAVDVVCDGRNRSFSPSPGWNPGTPRVPAARSASAIAAGLARGAAPLEAIKRAKEYITEAIRSGPPIGSGHGPPTT